MTTTRTRVRKGSGRPASAQKTHVKAEVEAHASTVALAGAAAQPEGTTAPTGTLEPALEAATPSTPPTRPTKAAQLKAMLAAPAGATLAHLCEALGWQSHTVRAALTRLRQAGHAVGRSRSEAGETVYRIAPASLADDDESAAGSAPQTSQGEPSTAADPAEPADPASAVQDGDAA